MRDGYLGALAARTLGVAPLLRPVTPSRFEPDGPGGGIEFAEVSDPAGGRHPLAEPDAAFASRAVAPEPPQRTARHADERLLPPVDPDRPVAGPVPIAPPAEPGEQAAGPEAVPPAPLVGADSAAAGIAALAQAFALPASVAEPDGPGPDRSAERAQSAPARRQSTDQGRESPARDTGDQAPAPVIVRIGRVDVRAGDAAPRPLLAPRAAAPSGPSLADHLAARDRELS